MIVMTIIINNDNHTTNDTSSNQANQALGQQHTWVVDRKMKACKMALKVYVNVHACRLHQE